MKDNKFVAQQPFVPKTETRIILEKKEPTKLVKLVSFLGIKKVYTRNEGNCSSCVSDALEKAIKIFHETAAKTGTSVTTSTTTDGGISITYTPKK
jgi:hypothetical protein